MNMTSDAVALFVEACQNGEVSVVTGCVPLAHRASLPLGRSALVWSDCSVNYNWSIPTFDFHLLEDFPHPDALPKKQWEELREISMKTVRNHNFRLPFSECLYVLHFKPNGFYATISILHVVQSQTIVTLQEYFYCLSLPSSYHWHKSPYNVVVNDGEITYNLQSGFGLGTFESHFYVDARASCGRMLVYTALLAVTKSSSRSEVLTTSITKAVNTALAGAGLKTLPTVIVIHPTIAEIDDCL